jgi:hypothetical protein
VGGYQVLSSPDYRKNMRYEHKSTILLANEHLEDFCYAQMFNFSGGGLYFESDFAFRPGSKIQIRFDRPPFRSAPKTLSSVVSWYRELPYDDSEYAFGIGAKFI